MRAARGAASVDRMKTGMFHCGVWRIAKIFPGKAVKASFALTMD